MKYGPQTFLNVQHSVSHNATTHSALMPTAAERAGDFSQSGVVVRDPRTGLPFEGNVIPSDRISPQAAALLSYYPLPNAPATAGANYQTPLLAAVQQDSLQVNVSKTLRPGTSLAGSFSFQRTETDSVSLFNFADASGATSINGSLNFNRRLTTRMTMRARYQFTRATTDVVPFFANRTNVSGDAGIIGNNQDPVNWGPPTLAFAGIAGLTDVQHQQTSRMSNSGGGEVLYRRGAHNLTMGGDVRGDRTEVLSQPDPRGTLSFTGPITGVPFADFLLGVPTASSIAFGDTATRLRAKAFDAYLNDDWRPLANLTINVGARWEYETPYTELAGHLVNLDVAPGFAAIAQVTPADPTGGLTGASYPASLIRPDKGGLQPRLGVSWRPSLSSSLVVKGGYGIYRNLGVYESIALLLAHQPPFATTFSIHNSLETPLTLANPFPSTLPGTTNTVAIDPDFRSGYAHTWQVTVQRELPASLTVIAAYLGAKGSHLMQAFLPNTYPTGAENPCTACPSGFVYITSNGSSLRNAAQFTLRRRLHAGLMAGVQYTIAKSTDDAATFANKVASVVGALDCPGLAQPRRRARPVVVRPAAPVVRAVSVHDRDGPARRHIGGWQVGHALQGLDGGQPAHHRQRLTADPDFLSCRQRYGRRRHPAGADGRADCAGGGRVVRERRGLHDARARNMGECRPQFDSRARAVLARPVGRARVPSGWSLESRMAPDRDQRAQPRHVRDDRHGGHEPAVRFPDARQSDADAAYGCEASLLICAAHRSLSSP